MLETLFVSNTPVPSNYTLLSKFIGPRISTEEVEFIPEEFRRPTKPPLGIGTNVLTAIGCLDPKRLLSRADVAKPGTLGVGKREYIRTCVSRHGAGISQYTARAAVASGIKQRVISAGLRGAG